MFRIICCKRLVMSLCFCVLMCCSSVSLAQDNDKPFVRLATYWDAPGVVNAISPDDRWIVIYDRNSDTSRLVEVATGKILASASSDYGIRFSPKGTYATIYHSVMEADHIIDLKGNKSIADVKGRGVQFSSNEALVITGEFDQAEQAYITRVIDVKTGDIKLEVAGMGGGFSPDSQLIAVTDTKKMVARIIEINTAKTLFEFPLQNYSEGETWNFNIRFSPDGQLLSIYQLHDAVTYIIDTADWKVLYNLEGFVGFSADSRYGLSRQNDSPAANEWLLDARSGKQLDTVYGNMWFSENGKLLYRMDSTKCDFTGSMRVIDLATMKSLVDIQDCSRVEMIANNAVAHVSKGDIDVPQVQQLIDVATGKVIWQAQVDDMEIVDYEQHIAQFTKIARQTIENFVSGEVFASDQVIKISNNHELAFASNGLLVDLYGAPDLHTDTMPASRSESGIVQAPEGKINVYPMPTVANPVVEENLNPFNFYVMGKSADEKWLYVTYTVYGHEIKRKQGWIENQNLSVIDDWHDVPVLGGDDPLGDLREISK